MSRTAKLSQEVAIHNFPQFNSLVLVFTGEHATTEAEKLQRLGYTFGWSQQTRTLFASALELDSLESSTMIAPNGISIPNCTWSNFLASSSRMKLIALSVANGHDFFPGFYC